MHCSAQRFLTCRPKFFRNLRVFAAVLLGESLLAVAIIDTGLWRVLFLESIPLLFFSFLTVLTRFVPFRNSQEADLVFFLWADFEVVLQCERSHRASDLGHVNPTAG